MPAHETYTIRAEWRRLREEWRSLRDECDRLFEDCRALLDRMRTVDGIEHTRSSLVHVPVEPADHVEANYNHAVLRYLELVQNTDGFDQPDSERVQCLDAAKQDVARWRELYLVQGTTVDR